MLIKINEVKKINEKEGEEQQEWESYRGEKDVDKNLSFPLKKNIKIWVY